MISLAKVLEWQYGPVANTKAVVEVDFKNFIKEDDILSRDKAGTRVKIFQSRADMYNLKYDSDSIEMVITKWSHSDIKKPSASQLKKDFAEYEKHLKSIAYKEKRATEYPSIKDQLDAIFKGDTDFEAMKSKIEAVKKKHPKG